MIHLRNTPLLRRLAFLLVCTLLSEVCVPAAAYALTSGPHSPEYSSFEPVSTTDMVNLTSGEFVYNLPVLSIPGPDGGGYGLSLSYHGGANAEEEASWVGFGWSLSPGALNRQDRGYPDDYNGAAITKYNKTRPNISASIAFSKGLEFFSKKITEDKKTLPKKSETSKPPSASPDAPAPPQQEPSTESALIGKAAFKYGVGNVAKAFNADSAKSLFNFSITNSIRFNNYTGFARSYGFDIGAKGVGGMGFDVGAEGVTFRANADLQSLFYKVYKKEPKINNDGGVSDKKRFIRRMKELAEHTANGMLSQLSQTYGSTYGIYSYGQHALPTSVVRQQRSRSSNWAAGLDATFTNTNIGFNAGLRGNVTIKKNEEVSNLLAHGYLHTPNDMQSNRESDYYVEKDHPYQKRNLFLGIPFNNADNFIYTGEGLGGSMRFFPKKVGTFYPNHVENITDIYQAGLDLSLGLSVGIGADFGIGSQRSIVKKWNQEGNTGAADFEEGSFRFKGDMAGSVSYGNSNLLTAQLERGNYGAAANLRDLNDFQLKTDEFSHSSYVEYHTAGSITPENRFNKKLNLANVGNVAAGNNGLIVETQVYNSDGMRYVYGQPVFNRNQTQLQVDVKKSQDKVVKNYLAYKPTGLHQQASRYGVRTDQHAMAIGEVRHVPYASTYLLTQIFSYDYVDVGNNGPDMQDFGGWTQLHYQKAYGQGTTSNGDNTWYRWRNPYNGLLYEENELSDAKDNVGSCSTAEKEVFYLKAIETKTHIAFFVTNTSRPERFAEVNTYSIPAAWLTGSGKSRLDGLGAPRLTASADPASESENAKDASQRTEYLEKIVLFHKQRPEKPIKTTHFAYDYSLVRNVPNNSNASYPAARSCDDCGKLTLRRVWFTYEGVNEARTSPYVFDYKYKAFNEFAPHIQERYRDILLANRTYSDGAQNPDYRPGMLDAWGNIQWDALDRREKKQDWVSQRSRTPEETEAFDPAAWQLKQITLPSGGQILIEYEEKDYRYVQDRDPMAMVSLLSSGTEPAPNTKPYYDINIADLGITPDDIPEQVAKLKAYFAENKLYFKFLFKLIGDGVPSLDDCRSEYITGYTQVNEKAIRAVGNSIRIPLASQESDDGYTATPRQACYDFYSSQRMGKWFNKDGYDCVGTFENEMERNEWRFSQNFFERLGYITNYMTQLVPVLQNHVDYAIPSKSKVGKTINHTFSYLKLPMIKAKRGGGIRVKQLLMYDRGLEDGDAVLYGQQYTYEAVEKDIHGNLHRTSSGVVDSEPSLEDDALVTFLPRKNQDWFSRITAGEDKEQSEGPLGRSILSGNSVMHSRVVVENIHKGASGTGFTVHEFTTPKDYPFDMLYKLDNPEQGYHSDLTDKGRNTPYVSGVEMTPLADNQYVPPPLVIPAGLFLYKQKRVYMAQGFRFIKMQYGQPKQIISYAGTYNPATLDNAVMTSAQKYDYYQPGEKVRMLLPDGRWIYTLPGKETDIAMESRSVVDKTLDFAIDVDLAIGISPPPPVIVSASLSFSLSNEEINTHATSKVIDYPSIVKRVRSFQDGVESTTDYLAFSPITGQPMLTRTEDSFDKLRIQTTTHQNAATRHNGSLYSLSLPASWYYKGIGRKYEKGIDYKQARSNQLTAGVSDIVSYGAEGNPLKDSTWVIPSNVLSVSLQTFDNQWLSPEKPYYDLLKTQYNVTAGTETALNSFWRPSTSYIYRDNVVAANTSAKGIREGGIMPTIQFPSDNDWTNGIADLTDKWVRQTRIRQYSPNGNPIEEENALDIPSTARFGYGNLLPTMVAANARYTGIYFEDYENLNAAERVQSVAHSGKQSLRFQAESSAEPLIHDLISDNILKPDASAKNLKGGARIRLWAHDRDQTSLGIRILANTIPMQRVARTGEWALYQADISQTDLPAVGTHFDVFLIYNGTDEIAIDDVKFQPLQAQGTCYVYDVATFRLLTQFDDQHFGLYYQYDAEGKLVRKLIETERGMKTVSETQYNTKKINTQQ